ncbi:MAG: T9SS type A sorting domain-containing protein [Bacteroidales bacterium]
MGQDGLHYNQSLLSGPNNTTVPSDVLNALYGMSDHLPVIIDLVVDDETGFANNLESSTNVSFNNPVKDQLNLIVNPENAIKLTIKLTDIIGCLIYSQTIHVAGHQNLLISTRDFNCGMYLLNLTDDKGSASTFKIIKKP